MDNYNGRSNIPQQRPNVSSRRSSSLDAYRGQRKRVSQQSVNSSSMKFSNKHSSAQGAHKRVDSAKRKPSKSKRQNYYQSGGHTIAQNPRKKGSGVLQKIIIVFAALLLFMLVDSLLNWGKIMPGIRVGDLDLGGKTVAQASTELSEHYGSLLSTGEMTLYAKSGISTEQEAQSFKSDLVSQLTSNQLSSDVLKWSCTATELDAALPSEELAKLAYDAGRGFSGIGARILALFGAYSVQPYASFSPTAIDNLSSEINAAISDPRVDYSVEVSHGQASVVEGHDGYMIDEDTLVDELNKQLFMSLDSKSTNPSLIYAQYCPLRISAEDAQKVADQVNAAIGDGVVFEYSGKAWLETPTKVGSWVTFTLAENDGSYSLVASIDENLAKSAILQYISQNVNIGDLVVSWTVENGTPYVTTNLSGTGKMPLVTNAVSKLNEDLFGSSPSNNAVSADGNPPEIIIEASSIPEKLDLQSALDCGIITGFASYTTKYSSGTGAEERNYNIHLMSDRLNYSIAKANGGVWSFNDTGGASDEEHGFKAAAGISEGLYVDSIGGGICQVATTIFNAVYEAGYRVVLRNNHSLYIQSYPLGRDCSVSYPDMDFKWANDTSSDVLVGMTYTDDSVTCTLYGVNPNYTVTTDVSEVTEGEAYTTKYVIKMKASSSYREVSTNGQNGSTVTVTRQVFKSDGNRLYEDVFVSNYKPRTEIIDIGYSTFAEEQQAAGLVIRVDDAE